MTIAYFDCVGGAAGDMLLASLIDAGCPLDAVVAALAACGLHEVRLETRPVQRGGLRSLALGIVESGEQRERDLSSCLRAVGDSSLPERARRRAQAALLRLGAVEARLHGASTPLGIRLHELSAVDTLVDAVGVAAALERLGVDDVYASPLPVATGMTASRHGPLPLPAPATLALPAEAGATLISGTPDVEHVTPTGAAILAAVARFEQPALRLAKLGHGAGSVDHPDRPNLVRCWIGEPIATSADEGDGEFDDPCIELRTNLDDVTPAVITELAERCLEAGALDAWVVPATMRKGRPGHVLHVLATPASSATIARVVLEQSPTLGVRRTLSSRMIAGRDVVRFDSPLGAVRVKRKHLRGVVVDARPELDDVRHIAELTGRPLHEVLDEVTAAARGRFRSDSAPEWARLR